MRSIHDFFHMTLFHFSGVPVTPASLTIFVVTMVLAIAFGNFARSAVRRILARHGQPAEGGVAYALGKITQYIVVAIGMLFALENLGLSIKSVAAIGAVLMVGIGFGLQNIAQNFISGIILLLERPVSKGDFVTIGDTTGQVEDIAMRATRILTSDGIMIIVPNSELISGRVINRSAPTTVSRIRIGVGAAYGSDVELVRKVLLEVANASPNILKTPKPAVYFRNFGESALEFQLAVWIDSPDHDTAFASEVRFGIDAAFRKAGIDIPFPQRDINLKTPLAEIVPKT